MKQKNQYFQSDNYMVGVTKSGEQFKFDKEDLELINKYWWHSIDSHGNKYIATKINNKTVHLHRLIMNYPNNDIDHINHDGADCRRINMRVCSRGENMGNRRKKKTASSAYKGVYFYKPTKKWAAQIQVNNLKKSLGHHITEVAAAVAYNTAAAFYFGEYANLNII